jgi:multiple sugar transport system permease protein/putative aldouronate transport system permease protein
MADDLSNLKAPEVSEREHLRRRLVRRPLSTRATGTAATVDLVIAQPYRTPFMLVFKRQWQLYLMVLLPVLFIAIFMYGPMFGIVVAFKDFSFRRGILGSEWVGLRYFRQFLTTPLFYSLLWNTVALSAYSLIAGFFTPILLALALNEIRSLFFKKTVQMVTYFPYFISTVVMVGIVLQVLNPRGGIVNNIITMFGGTPVNFMGVPALWRSIYVWSGVWQLTGYGAIIYLAALSGVDPGLIDSAIIDGVNRPQRVRYIDLPTIAPTIIILLILAVGNIMSVGFEKAYILQNNINLNVSEIISTYVYKRGLVNYQYSFATAVGVFNSIVNFLLLVTANSIARRTSETNLW